MKPRNVAISMAAALVLLAIEAAAGSMKTFDLSGGFKVPSAGASYLNFGATGKAVDMMLKFGTGTRVTTGRDNLFDDDFSLKEVRRSLDGTSAATNFWLYEYLSKGLEKPSKKEMRRSLDETSTVTNFRLYEYLSKKLEKPSKLPKPGETAPKPQSEDAKKPVDSQSWLKSRDALSRIGLSGWSPWPGCWWWYCPPRPCCCPWPPPLCSHGVTGVLSYVDAPDRNEVPDLRGKKMRTTVSYSPMLRALGISSSNSRLIEHEFDLSPAILSPATKQ